MFSARALGHQHRLSKILSSCTLAKSPSELQIPPQRGGGKDEKRKKVKPCKSSMALPTERRSKPRSCGIFPFLAYR